MLDYWLVVVVTGGSALWLNLLFGLCMAQIWRTARILSSYHNTLFEPSTYGDVTTPQWRTIEVLSLFSSLSPAKAGGSSGVKFSWCFFFFLGRHGISGTKYKSCHVKKFLAFGLFCGLQRVFRAREGVRVRRDRGVDNGLCPRCQNTFRTVKPAMANHGQLKRRRGLPEVVQCSAPIYQCFSLASMT